jgi:uncharacterized protein YyaL (SSP411 family)
MQHDTGGFFTAVDADSEGYEGRFAVFSYAEFVETVAGCGEDARLFAPFFGVSEDGNFEGVNVLSEPVDRDTFAVQHGLDTHTFAGRLDTVIHALRAVRDARVQPIVDDKMLTDLNGLAVRALVAAGTQLDRPAYVAAARKAGTFLTDVQQRDGMLYHSSKDGQVGVKAFASDYASYALAQLHLFSLEGDVDTFNRALTAATVLHERFVDSEDGGYFTTADDAETLLIRPKDVWDNATPSASSMMVEVCLLLSAITGDALWRTRAEDVIASFQTRIQQNPAGYGWLLRQYETLAAGLRLCVIIGDDTPERKALAAVAYAAASPNLFTIVTANPSDTIGVFAGRTNIGTPTAYVCEELVCLRPVTTSQELEALLADG